MDTLKRDLARLTPDARSVFEGLPLKEREDAWRAAGRLKGRVSFQVIKTSEPGAPASYDLTVWDAVEMDRTIKVSAKTLSVAFRDAGRVAFDWHKADMEAYLATQMPGGLSAEDFQALYDARLSALLKG